MRIPVYVKRLPELNWSWRGSAITPVGCAELGKKIREDPTIVDWHFCGDLDEDIDGTSWPDRSKIYMGIPSDGPHLHPKGVE